MARSGLEFLGVKICAKPIDIAGMLAWGTTPPQYRPGASELGFKEWLAWSVRVASADQDILCCTSQC